MKSPLGNGLRILSKKSWTGNVAFEIESIADPVVSFAQSTSVVKNTLANIVQGGKLRRLFISAWSGCIGILIKSLGTVWMLGNKFCAEVKMGDNNPIIKNTFMSIGLGGQKKGKFGNCGQLGEY